MEAVSAAPEAPAQAETEFHAAEDVALGEEELRLELQDVEMEPIEEAAAPAEEMIALEPEMRAEPSLDLGEMPAAAPAAMEEPTPEFVAVPETLVEDEDLLELNLDQIDAGAAAATMAEPEFQPMETPMMEEAIPLTEQVEIPAEIRMGMAETLKPMGAMPAAAMAEPRVAAMARAGAAPALQPAQPAQAAAASLLGSDILLSVSHRISVELGALTLNGKDLLDIAYGSVLPLERAIGEPVDLVLENKTIGQAEVVLINGKNLGVRIVALNR
jgi:flagellar motor switch protein FliN/FliY